MLELPSLRHRRGQRQRLLSDHRASAGSERVGDGGSESLPSSSSRQQRRRRGMSAGPSSSSSPPLLSSGGGVTAAGDLNEEEEEEGFWAFQSKNVDVPTLLREEVCVCLY